MRRQSGSAESFILIAIALSKQDIGLNKTLAKAARRCKHKC
ncbi:MAG: hypothetical protein AAFR58_26055 [Cyanobacteria bacterium J06627_28]